MGWSAWQNKNTKIWSKKLNTQRTFSKTATATATTKTWPTATTVRTVTQQKLQWQQQQQQHEQKQFKKLQWNHKKYENSKYARYESESENRDFYQNMKIVLIVTIVMNRIILVENNLAWKPGTINLKNLKEQKNKK